ncbi:MAG: hypothetical protein JW784_05820 [Candidatus Cloacimonetes bacterium]|nr:hypothetical protein [Candidatus Cloacimonadota bacterium]
MKGCLGSICKIVGWSSLVLGILLAFWYFYLDSGILFFFPALASEIPIAELVDYEQEYHNRWVKVEGEIKPAAVDRLLFIPVITDKERRPDQWNSSPEQIIPEEDSEMPFNEGVYPELILAENTGLRNICLPSEGRVVILGRFSKSTKNNDRPQLKVAFTENHYHDFQTCFNVLMQAVTDFLLIFFGIILLRWGYKLSRSNSSGTGGVHQRRNKQE